MKNILFSATKKLLLLVLLVSFLLINATLVYADSIKLYLNGEEIAPLPEDHQEAIYENGVLYLPLRNVFEAIGAQVIYDAEDAEMVYGGMGNIYYINNIGDIKLVTNENEYTLSNKTIIVNNRTLIVKEALNYIFGAEVVCENNNVNILYENDDSIWEVDLSNVDLGVE